MSSSPIDSAQARIVVVTMPQMGVSVAEGTIVEWRKQPGDWIESDETICDISTDKIDTEIPSPASGRVVRILVEPGKTVSVGTPLAEIDASAQRGSPDGNGAEPDRSRVVSPVVQRIAAEHDVDLSGVTGTGVGGRIRKKDLLAYIEARGREVEVPRDTRPEPRLHTESPYHPQGEERATEAASTERSAGGEDADTAPPAGARREPLSAMRRQVAEHMVKSRRTAAHVTTVAEVDMSKVAAKRAQLRDAFGSRGVPLTYLAFVARATISALHEQPIFNASLDGEEIVYQDDVNLGIAVALDAGLIVPVIHRAQRLSLEGLAAAIAELAGRARSNQLEHRDVEGGTFTITNPGQFGTVLATPIINQPQVAILDLEAVVKRPVVVEGQDGDSIGIRPTTNLCLSFDHRVIDGAEAARFLGSVKARLERPADESE